MDNNNIQQPQPKHNVRALIGIALLGVGGILLLQQLNILFIPEDLRLWPLWLVFWGCFIGVRSTFNKPSSFILVGLGILFLLTENIDGSKHFIWPVGIIGFGLWIILRPKGNFTKDKDYWDRKYKQQWDWRGHTGNPAGTPPPTSDATYTEVPPAADYGSDRPKGDDWLDAVSVFGGVKKMILSKDFKGGEIVNVFGGAELDFTQADIKGQVYIDITQIFGGVKMVVPSNWQVVSDVSAVFASVDDKRIRSVAPLSSDKILVLKGVSIFAGIDIRSF